MKWYFKVINRMILYIRCRPKLKKIFVSILNRFPYLKIKLVSASVAIKTKNKEKLSIEFEQLTPQARRIYLDLKKAIEQHQKEAG